MSCRIFPDLMRFLCLIHTEEILSAQGDYEGGILISLVSFFHVGRYEKWEWQGGTMSSTHSQRNQMSECGSAPSQNVFWAAVCLAIIGLALKQAMCQGLLAKSSSGVND